jgi:hypothetical protein
MVLELRIGLDFIGDNFFLTTAAVHFLLLGISMAQSDAELTACLGIETGEDGGGSSVDYSTDKLPNLPCRNN